MFPQVRSRLARMTGTLSHPEPGIRSDWILEKGGWIPPVDRDPGGMAHATSLSTDEVLFNDTRSTPRRGTGFGSPPE
jgi:hypothetical protein